MEQQESQGALDCREHQDNVGHKEMWGLKERKETLPMDHLDCREHQDHVDHREVQELKDRRCKRIASSCCG